MRLKTRLGLAAVTGAGLALALRQIQRENRAIDLKERVAVISGGSRGLGLAIAQVLADEGAHLILMARDRDELERARQQLAGQGAKVEIVACDVRDREEVLRCMEQAVEHHGRIDILMNVAGVIQVGPLAHMTIKDFEEAMAVHTWGPLYTMLAAAPHMRRQGGGRIVNISSIGGKVAVPHMLPYSTSKFALVGLSDGMRVELAQDNIHVTTVCPGLMRTGSHLNALFKGDHEAEFTWFSILGALPFTSTTAQSAARQIVKACRYGDPYLVITPQARLASLANEIAPRLMATGMALLNTLLPQPSDSQQGEQLKPGWESWSSWSPSVLTHLSDRATETYNELRGHSPEELREQKPLVELTLDKTSKVMKIIKENNHMTHRVTKSIIVNGTVQEIFDIWANFENFPHFMKHIKSVTKTGPDTSHWLMKSLLGKTIEWDAKLTQLDPNKRIAWNSMEGGDITTSGQVTFNALPQNQVEVTVILQYVPPAGKVGEALAALFENPEEKLEEDLRNFKAYAEGASQRVHH